MNLYLIPVEFMYGGGYSLLIKAQNIDEAKLTAKQYGLEHQGSVIMQQSLSDEHDYGDIEKFDRAPISYYE